MLLCAASACSGLPFVPMGAVPAQLEGHALGEPMERVLARLRGDGWTLEQEVRPGGRSIEVRGRQTAHKRLRYIRASFTDGRLYYLRVGYRHAFRRVGRAYLVACRGLSQVGGSGMFTQCTSPDRSRAVSVGRRGDRVTLLDLSLAVQSRAASAAGVASMLGPVPLTGSPTFPGARVKGPLSTEHEDLRLGDPMTAVLERFKPPTWKLRTFGRERNGVRYRHVQLRSPDHSRLREMLLDFIDRKLVRARFYFRRNDPALVAAQRQLCAGHLRVPARFGHSACREDWLTLRAFDEAGRSLRLVDLKVALSSGLMLREEIDERAASAGPTPPRGAR